jgi:hypothetical protein
MPSKRNWINCKINSNPIPVPRYEEIGVGAMHKGGLSDVHDPPTLPATGLAECRRQVSVAIEYCLQQCFLVVYAVLKLFKRMMD